MVFRPTGEKIEHIGTHVIEAKENFKEVSTLL
jgi:hypothetical protein